MPKGQNIPFTQTKMKGYDEIKASGTKQDYENLFQRIDELKNKIDEHKSTD